MKPYCVLMFAPLMGASMLATAATPRPDVFAPGSISSMQNDASPAFASDGKTVFFMRGEHGNWTLMESHRIGNDWSVPRIAPFSGHWRDLDPAMAADGSYLLFVSNRPSMPGGKRLDAADSHGKVYPGFGMNIWRVDRRGNGWGEPIRLPGYINASDAVFAPSVAADGALYYMARDTAGAYHVFRSACLDGRYQKPVQVELGRPGDIIRDVAIAPDESFAVFSVIPAGKKQPLRLAIAFRTHRNWGQPIDLGDTVNDSGYALGSQLGPDHRTLYFYSARIDSQHPTGAKTWNNGSTNIWSVSLVPWLDAHRKYVASQHAVDARASMIGPGVISTGVQETSVAMAPNGNTIYFMRSDFGEKDDTIMVSHRNGGPWSAPEIASFSGQWHDSEPTLSPDGRRLYFVSNRPLRPGGTPLTAQMFGQSFTGTNLWYVQRQADGAWGKPKHVDGALNDGNMIYNPSVAANGDIYFSAHREDSGNAYQIYVARFGSNGYAAPARIDLGDIKHSRMDPAVDPQQRFLIYAGNEGDALGRADLYIAFHNPDGSWSKPEHLPGDVNSAALENAPSLGPSFGELFVSSNRSDELHFPKSRDTAATLGRRIAGPLNGSRNLWHFDISDVLRAHGIEH